MAYKQKWGMSRKASPLNKFPVDEDPSRNDIIQQNNKASNTQKDTFADVGMDVVDQLHDKWKSKGTLGKIDMVGRALFSKGASLIGEVDTSKLDSDKLDEAQDYATIASGGIGLTGWGQIPSIAMDVANTAFSGKRAFDNFRAGKKKEGWKNVGKGGATALTILPGPGEYKALQKSAKYSKKAMTAADRLGPTSVGGPKNMISTMSAPMSVSGKIAGWLTRKFS